MQKKLTPAATRLTPAATRLETGGSWRDGRASSTARGYNYAWQVARAAFLLLHPLCSMCRIAGVATAASVVDHVRPHRGCMVLFWDRNNWQALCAHCHSSHKQRQEHAAQQ